MFARYSRYPGTLRRLFLDEFADSLPARVGGERRRRGRAGGGALRAHLRRLRRRLGGAARRRAHRLRVGLQRPDEDPAAAAAGGLPGAVDALHRLRRADARRRLPLLPRRVAGPGVRGGDGHAVRRLRGVAAARLGVGGRDVPGHARRVRGRAPPRGQGEGAGPAARPAARRVAVAHGHLRERPGVRAADHAPARAPAARGARVRPADARGGQGRDPELRLPHRASRPRRRLGRLPERPPRRRAPLDGAAGAGPRGRRRGALLRAARRTSTATEDLLLAVAALRGRRRSRGADAGGRRALSTRRARDMLARPRGHAREPPPPPRPRLRGAALPLRDRLRLRRVPRPAAPPHAHRPVAGR